MDMYTHIYIYMLNTWTRDISTYLCRCQYIHAHLSTLVYIHLRRTSTRKATHHSCVAVCCSVLQSVAVCCSVLQCVAECCSALQCVADTSFLNCKVQHCVRCTLAEELPQRHEFDAYIHLRREYATQYCAHLRSAVLHSENQHESISVDVKAKSTYI